MIKLFEQFNNEQEIHDICKNYEIRNYSINPDGSIDVDGDVYLFFKHLSKIPIKFNKVSGFFNCSKNVLTSLEGCPNDVGGYFYCYYNKLTSLEGSPERVGGDFKCYENNLTSLEGCPMIIDGSFNIENNPISVIDSSIEVKKDIYIDDTDIDDKIKYLSQDKLKILFEHGVDYDIFRKDGSINDSRLERLFKDFNI